MPYAPMPIVRMDRCLPQSFGRNHAGQQAGSNLIVPAPLASEPLLVTKEDLSTLRYDSLPSGLLIDLSPI